MAWEDLKKRYDRTEELINEYIRKFLEAKPVEHRATPVTLRKIIDLTNQMLRAVPNLGAKVDYWDPITNLIICTKLNDDLRAAWEIKKESYTAKTTKDLLRFLEGKAIELQPKQSEKLSQMLKGDPRSRLPQKKVFQITDKKTETKSEPKKESGNKKECLMCKGNHHVWDCNMLKKESAKARTRIIRALGLCFKCLLKHCIGMCDNEDCEYCGGPHHVMLCYKRENEEKLKPVKPKAIHSQQSPGGPKPSTSKQNEDWADWNEPAVKKN